MRVGARMYGLLDDDGLEVACTVVLGVGYGEELVGVDAVLGGVYAHSCGAR